MKIKYDVIFTLGNTDVIEEESKYRELRLDILLSQVKDVYYNPRYFTIERLNSEFKYKKDICYLEENLVILDEITKENILKSIPEIHNWLFQKRWLPVSIEQIEKYFYPKEKWVTFNIEVESNGMNK